MRRLLLITASVGALGALVVLLAAFVWPDLDAEVELGRVEEFAPGSVTSFYAREVDGEYRELAPGEAVENPCASPPHVGSSRLGGTVIHLVRFEDGSFLALSGEGTHMGEMVPWMPDFSRDGQRGWFWEPCHSDTYATDGSVVFGPAPRGLSRFALRIDEGTIVVDPTDVTPGARVDFLPVDGFEVKPWATVPSVAP